MPYAQPLRTGDPQRLGDYELSGRLGEGGQGVVFLGTRAEESFAVKLLHGPVGEEQAAFLREVELAKHVARFCTAQVIDAGFDEGRPYIVSEYVDGPSLHREVALTGPRRGGALERLAVGTATALAAIHRAGIVHRDLKPQNVLLGPDGPRVIDFGLAKALDAAATVSGRGVGTPAYMAPEQITASAITGAVDVFSWGATMCFAANASAPFGQDSVAPVLHRILTAAPELGRLEGQLRGLVGHCLDKDPRNRPTSRDLLLSLLGAGEEVPAEVLRSPPPHILRVEPGGIAEPEVTGVPGGYRMPDSGPHPGSHPGPHPGPIASAGPFASPGLEWDPGARSDAGPGRDPGAESRPEWDPGGGPGPAADGGSRSDPWSGEGSTGQTATGLWPPPVGGEMARVRRPAVSHVAHPDGGAGSWSGGGSDGVVTWVGERSRRWPGPAANRMSVAVSGALLVSAAVLVAVLVPALRSGSGTPVAGPPPAVATVVVVPQSGSSRELADTPGSEPREPLRGSEVGPGIRPAVPVAGIRVPAIVGLDRGAAIKALKQAGFAVGKVSDVDSRERLGRVVRTVPAAGVTVVRGARVDLEVAAGLRVPSLAGRELGAAQAALTKAGLSAGAVSRVCSTRGGGEVISTKPGAGKRVAPGAAVALVVARNGAQVPSVVGQSQQEARRALRGAGLGVRERAQIVDQAQAGRVLAQDVAAGTCARPGRVVLITVGVAGQDFPDPTEPGPDPEPSVPATPSPEPPASGANG